MTIDRWGCPDWRDASAYPVHSDELEDWEWRWQFLRRMPGYRNLFLQLPEITPDIIDPQPTDDFRPLGGAVAADPELARVWTLFNMRVIRNPRKQTLESNPFQLRTDGLFSLPSREELEDTVFHAGPREHRFTMLLDQLDELGLTRGSKAVYAYFQFDLSSPLNPQLQRARIELESIAGRQKTPRLKGKDRDRWPKYLRVIDAEDQGAGDTVIFEQFQSELIDDRDAYDSFGGEQPLVMIADWRKAARAAMKKTSLYL